MYCYRIDESLNCLDLKGVFDLERLAKRANVPVTVVRARCGDCGQTLHNFRCRCGDYRRDRRPYAYCYHIDPAIAMVTDDGNAVCYISSRHLPKLERAHPGFTEKYQAYRHSSNW